MQISDHQNYFGVPGLVRGEFRYPGIPVSFYPAHFLACLYLLVLPWTTMAADAPDVPVHKFDVVNTYPHDPNAFTQGLVFHDGKLYEGTGRNGQSTLRLVDLETGEMQKRHQLNEKYFGEGITILGDRIYQLTWQSHVGFVYDLDTFTQQKSFFLAGEGWGITDDGDSLIVSDGTDILRFLDPDTLQERRRVKVTVNGNPLQYLNELEYINGEVWANVWYQDVIVRIDPESGKVNSVIDMSELYPNRSSRDAVLNGIAWDEAGQRLVVTGKLWPSLYEINVLE